MLQELPYEIIYSILLRLDNRSLVKFLSVNKKISNIAKDNMLWKIKCITEYSQKHLYSMPKNVNYFKYYKMVYSNLCVGCFLITRSKDVFYNDRVCNDCQKNIKKYQTISKSNLKRDFALKDNEFLNLECRQIYNKVGTRVKKTVYLVTEVHKYLRKYNLINTVRQRIKTKFEKYFTQMTLKCTRINILQASMMMYHNIDAILYHDIINDYSRGYYLKYVRNTNPARQEQFYFYITVYCFIEMDYLVSVDYTIINTTFTRFEDTLLEILINDRDTIGTSNWYIEDKKQKLLLSRQEIFLRKDKILRYIQKHNLPYNITDSKVLEYIYTGNFHISFFKIKYLEDMFFNQTFGNTVIINLALRQGVPVYVIKESLLIDYINTYPEAEIPEYILKNYNLRPVTINF